MGAPRRRFDHLHVELCVAAGARVPRFALWMALAESGADPRTLRRAEVLAFCDGPLRDFLRERRLAPSARALRQLRRRAARFDASHPTPDERFAALTR